MLVTSTFYISCNVFYPSQKQISIFQPHLFCCLQILLILDQSKILSFSRVNPLPNEKNLDVTKLKAFADDKSKVARMMIFLLDREENTRKRRKCWLPAFSLYPTVFS